METKIRAYIRTWEQRCYPGGIPDEGPAELGDKVPSYKRICIAILKNDVTLKSLGLPQPVSELYGVFKRIELGIPEPKKINNMNQLLVSELKKFKKAAALVSGNNILDILSYIKIEPGLITKNTLNAFATMKIGYTGKPFLIEETVLFDYVNRAHEFIDVAIADKVITLSAGGIATSKSGTYPIGDFPALPAPTTEPVVLPEQIAIASEFIDPALTPEAATVFLGDGCVTSCNGFIGFMAPTPPIDKIYLDARTCQAIGEFEGVRYSQNGSYNFLQAGDYNLGFVKTEYKYLDIRFFFKLPETQPFILNTAAIIKFNEQAISNSVTKPPFCLMTIDHGELLIEMIDKDYSRQLTQSFVIEGDVVGTFNYNPVLLNRLLKAMPDDSCNCYLDKNRLYFTGEGGWVALIMEIVKI